MAFLRCRARAVPRVDSAERSGAPSALRAGLYRVRVTGHGSTGWDPLGVTPDRHGGANVAIWAQGASAVRALPLRRGRPRGPHPADRARVQRLPRAHRRPARRHAVRLPRRTASGTRPSATGGTPTSCCSIPTRRPSTGAFRLEPRRLRPRRRRRPDDRDAGRLRAVRAQCVVVDDDFDWGDDQSPGTAWGDTVIYETHVRASPSCTPPSPSTCAAPTPGLTHPAVIEHLTTLGVTAVELLPVHHFVDEVHLLELGLTNYWGYNSIGFFAPHAAYSLDRTPRRPGRASSSRWSRRCTPPGIEVILDVVYNHTGEGNQLGPTLSLPRHRQRRLLPPAPTAAATTPTTPAAATPSTSRQPHVLRLVMDSLRYWVEEMHVDGFRFDLASALARSFHDVDMLGNFMTTIQQDPVLRRVKLIAEPWDVGPGGYQVGEFPPLWTEWNDKYRDTIRDFWRGAAGDRRARLAAVRIGGPVRLGGAAAVRVDQLRHRARRLHAARPGLLRAQAQRGQPRGQPRRHQRQPVLRTTASRARPTTRRSTTLRTQQMRNLLATLLLSTGVPDDRRRRRVRPHPGRQQQRLLPGQRDLLVRLALGALAVRPQGLRQPDPAPAPGAQRVPAAVLLRRQARCTPAARRTSPGSDPTAAR